MALQASTTGEPLPNPTRNAGSGTILTVPAGGRIEAEWDFVNDSPDVAGFHLQADGLPSEDWVSGTGEPCSTWAAASGSGCIRLALAPPREAAPGDYPFRVSVISGGASVGAGVVSLILRVTPALALEEPETVVAEPEPTIEVGTAVPAVEPSIEHRVVAPETVVETSPVSTPLVPKKTPKTKVAPVKAAPEPVAVAPVVEPQVIAPPIAEPQVVEYPPDEDSEAPTVQSWTPAIVPEVKPPPVTEPMKPVPPKPPVAEPIVSAPPKPPVVETVTPPPPPPSRPEPVEDQLPVIDYDPNPRRNNEPEPEEEEEQAPAEPSIVDPTDGTVISLCPGESRWVRFTFINDSAQERTYILDEDRSLDLGWISLVQDQVNLTRNGRGEVSIRLTPPKNAEPGDYPFLVTVGLQGGTLTPVSLTLSVLATPAVRLAAKMASVTVGPVGCDVNFPLTVDSAGNADTAFRIAVKSPEARTNSTEPAGPEFIYETAQWRYLFDRELDTLRSPASGRAPQPVSIRLKLRRRGIWWFGFREAHQVRVSAAPVTDPLNGGKPGNTVDLTATRWRLLPFPWFVMVPIVLMLMLYLSGGASSLEVPGAYQDEAGQYWVATPAGEKKDLTLKWTAAPLALLRLTGRNGDTPILSAVKAGSGAYSDQVTVSSQDRKVTNNYRISRWIGGGDRDAVVSFIFTRGDTPLLVTDAVTHQPLTGTDLNLVVPASGYARLDLRNMSPQSTRIDWWLTKGLHDTSAFQFSYIKNSGSIEQGGVEHLLIKRRPTAEAGAADRIVFVTTDATRPVVTVNLTSGQ
ncbi:MAG: hypothetical protein ABIY70_24930 [Capsulimonas sp.]|uniref:COG1470 family protein n=1 Tax=Capsulimonas sp. TaxID=2494211 RepID=UPI0032651764